MTRSPKDGSGRAVATALAANLGVAGAKLVAFVATRSAAILAEAIHSVADSINEVLLVVGRRGAEEGPTEHHPFGHARDRYVFAFAVSIVLFVGSGALVVWRGIDRMRAPEPIAHPAWAIAVIGVAIALEGWSLRTAAVRTAKPRHEHGLGGYWRYAKTPELVVVLVEDFGALVGLGLALAGVIAAVATGDGRWDGAAGLAVGSLMIGLSLILWRKTRSLLIGEAALPSVAAAIEQALADGDVLLGARDLRTQHLGPRHLLVTSRVAVARGVRGSDITGALAAAKARIRAAVGHDCLIYLEPQLA